MRPTPSTLPFAALTLALALLPPQVAQAGRTRGAVNNHERVGFETFSSPQANPIALSPAATASTWRTPPATR